MTSQIAGFVIHGLKWRKWLHVPEEAASYASDGIKGIVFRRRGDVLEAAAVDDIDVEVWERAWEAKESPRSAVPDSAWLMVEAQ